jgi:phosphatidylinositol-3-phosphatase
VPQFAHVFLLVEENHSYSSVIGNSSMPYLNSLASKYGLATQYFADTHPSIGNYFMLTTGQIITNDDSFGATVDADNIVRHLVPAGKTWRSYAEGLPAVGYLADGPYPYAKNHNPFSYFSDVVNSSTQAANIVPFSQFPSDLSSGHLADFSFIAPDLQNDAHDGSLGQADGWLQQNIGPLISNPVFQNSLLIIVFDESDLTDWENIGGHVAALIVSPKAKSGYKSITLYQHQNTLRLILRALGISSFPGAAADAQDMSEFF